MDLSVTLPLDNGYLRRECPSCCQQFKWRHTEDSSEHGTSAMPTAYFCPYCGKAAPHDSWWTSEQVEYFQAVMARPAADEVSRMFERELRRMPKGLVEFEFRPASTAEPPPLAEPQDMLEIELSCHPEEPLKIREHWTGQVHCLICGKPHTLS